MYPLKHTQFPCGIAVVKSETQERTQVIVPNTISQQTVAVFETKYLQDSKDSSDIF